jgi:hypothetical protein
VLEMSQKADFGLELIRRHRRHRRPRKSLGPVHLGNMIQKWFTLLGHPVEIFISVPAGIILQIHILANFTGPKNSCYTRGIMNSRRG